MEKIGTQLDTNIKWAGYVQWVGAPFDHSQQYEPSWCGETGRAADSSQYYIKKGWITGGAGYIKNGAVGIFKEEQKVGE